MPEESGDDSRERASPDKKGITSDSFEDGEDDIIEDMDFVYNEEQEDADQEAQNNRMH